MHALIAERQHRLDRVHSSLEMVAGYATVQLYSILAPFTRYSYLDPLEGLHPSIEGFFHTLLPVSLKD